MGNLVARLECSIDPTGDTLGLWDDDVKAPPAIFVRKHLFFRTPLLNRIIH